MHICSPASCELTDGKFLPRRSASWRRGPAQASSVTDAPIFVYVFRSMVVADDDVADKPRPVE